jgi:YesN/AraC family two-component response regulator
MRLIKVLICDDHEIVRTGLRMLLLAEDDIEIIGEAAFGMEAVEKAKALHPDVDPRDMPGVFGSCTHNS